MAYAAGWLGAAGYDLIFGIDYVAQPEMAEYNAIIDEIQLYKPGYSELHSPEWMPGWIDYYDLLDTLFQTQVDYVALHGRPECSANFNRELYDRAKAGVEFRLQIYAVLDTHNTEIERLLKLEYENYKANGGELTYEDWLAQGMPEGPNSLTRRVSDKAAVLIASKQPGELINLVALSRASVDGTDVGRSFTNLPGSIRNFPGIQNNRDGTFNIIDRDAYINHVDTLIRNDGNPLNPVIRERILNFVGDDSTRIFTVQGKGIPGLHAEVQAVVSGVTKL